MPPPSSRGCPRGNRESNRGRAFLGPSHPFGFIKKAGCQMGCGIRGGLVAGKGGKECGRRRQCAALLAACRAASWRACLRRTRAGGACREVLHASVRGRVLGVLGLAGSVHESVQCA